MVKRKRMKRRRVQKYTFTLRMKDKEGKKRVFVTEKSGTMEELKRVTTRAKKMGFTGIKVVRIPVI